MPVLPVTTPAGAFALSGAITPAAIGADQNDYDPAGLSGAAMLRLAASTPGFNLTGLAGGSSGRILILHNVGSFPITLKDEAAGSTAANRFALTADMPMSTDAVAILQYDSTSSRWRVVSGGGSATDPDAIHDNVAGEIAAVTEKVTPVSADLLLIEDSAAGNAKKRVQIGNMPGGTSSTPVTLGHHLLVDPENYSDTMMFPWTAQGPATGDLAGSFPSPTVKQSSVAFAFAGVISPGGLSADADDYDPPGLATANTIRLTAMSPGFSITGIVGGTTGRMLFLYNIGNNPIRLVQKAPNGSTITNRFEFDGFDIVMFAGQGVVLQYDNTSNRWRACGETPTSVLPGAAVLSGVLTPAALTVNTNNYKPAGIEISSALRLSATTPGWDLTGIQDGVQGRIYMLINVGSFPITLKHDDAGSNTIDRFLLTENVVLAPDESCFIEYDGTTNRWRGVDQRKPTGAATGDLAGTFPSPTVKQSSTAFALTGIITPTTIAANQNDYSPTGLSTSNTLRLSASTPGFALTGLAGGATGRLLILQNVGSFPITLNDDNAGSAAANRFALQDAVDLTLNPSDGCLLQYDATLTRWQVVGSSTISATTRLRVGPADATRPIPAGYIAAFRGGATGNGIYISAGEIAGDILLHIEDQDGTLTFAEVHADAGQWTLGATYAATLAARGVVYGVDNQWPGGGAQSDFNTEFGGYRVSGDLVINNTRGVFASRLVVDGAVPFAGQHLLVDTENYEERTFTPGPQGNPGATGGQGALGPPVYLTAEQGDEGDRGAPGPTGPAGTNGAGAPGGATTQIQYNSAGAFAGSASLTWDNAAAEVGLNGDILQGVIAVPAAPAGSKVKLLAFTEAGRPVHGLILPGGELLRLQTRLDAPTALWLPQTGATLGLFGMGSTNAGTVSHPALAITNAMTAQRRTQFASAAGAGSFAGPRGADRMVYRGDAATRGGFFFSCRFAMTTTLANARAFVGLNGSTAALTNVDPSGLATDIIGVCLDSASANWTMITNDNAGACTTTDLGASYVKSATAMYELMMYCAPNAADIFWQIEIVGTATVSSGTFLNTNLPRNTIFLTPYVWITNNATASAAQIEMSRLYLETTVA